MMEHAQRGGCLHKAGVHIRKGGARIHAHASGGPGCLHGGRRSAELTEAPPSSLQTFHVEERGVRRSRAVALLVPQAKYRECVSSALGMTDGSGPTPFSQPHHFLSAQHTLQGLVSGRKESKALSSLDPPAVAQRAGSAALREAAADLGGVGLRLHSHGGGGGDAAWGRGGAEGVHRK